MRRYLSLLVLFASTLPALSTSAQTANEVIDKYLAATGGKDKLAAINTITVHNTVNVMGNDAPNTVVIVNGKGYRSESEINGQKMVQVYTDKGGWMINPMAGGTGAQKMPDEQAKSGQSQIYVSPFLDYAAKGNKVELAGKEKVGDVEAIKVKMTDKNSQSAVYYFDPSTYYLIKMVKSVPMMGQSTDLTMKYADFKKIDQGWVVPQTIDFDFGGQFQMTSKLQSVEVNTSVDPKVFEMP